MSHLSGPDAQETPDGSADIADQITFPTNPSHFAAQIKIGGQSQDIKDRLEKAQGRQEDRSHLLG